MPRPGPNPPRVPIARKHTDDALQVAASAIGLMVSAARNRAGLTQAQVARRAGTTQRAVSFIELGKPDTGANDATIASIFRVLRLSGTGRQASFVKWWRDNG